MAPTETAALAVEQLGAGAVDLAQAAGDLARVWAGRARLGRYLRAEVEAVVVDGLRQLPDTTRQEVVDAIAEVLAQDAPAATEESEALPSLPRLLALWEAA